MIAVFLLFAGFALLLATEGACALRLLAKQHLTTYERWFLGFPLGTFFNVLLFFLLTLFGIPLGFWAVYGAHALITAAFLLLSRTKVTVSQFPIPNSQFPINSQFSILNSQFPKKVLIALLLLSLTVKVLFAFSHAVLLPSFYYDSLSQWNMRARISYEDRAIAFDLDEARGMSKPQYPILLHSLQIASMLPQQDWLDSVANGSTILLTLSSFTALFLLLRRGRGTLLALLTVAVLSMIPLLSFHGTQGYADIHVIEYLLLSAVFLTLACQRHPAVRGSEEPSGSRRERSRPEGGGVEGPLLLLSGLFVAAAAWVKQEGLYFGVIPWIALVAVQCWKVARVSEVSDVTTVLSRSMFRQYLLFGFLPASFLGFLWTIFLLFRGMPLSPHGNTGEIAFHSEAVLPALKALFSFGSFGIFFYALPLVLVMLLREGCKDWQDALPSFLVIAWGGITFLGALFLFLATPAADFLLNNQTFHRTMLIPLTLLILGCVSFFKEGCSTG